MKRIARILSFAVGIAALVWAMRDRFISLALPREAQPPPFRHSDEHPNVPHRPPQATAAPAAPPKAKPSGAPSDDLRVIKGIGPVFATKLADMDITTFADLAGASADTVADGLGIAAERVSDWMSQARQHL